MYSNRRWMSVVWLHPFHSKAAFLGQVDGADGRGFCQGPKGATGTPGGWLHKTSDLRPTPRTEILQRCHQS